MMKRHFLVEIHLVWHFFIQSINQYSLIDIKANEPHDSNVNENRFQVTKQTQCNWSMKSSTYRWFWFSNYVIEAVNAHVMIEILLSDTIDLSGKYIVFRHGKHQQPVAIYCSNGRCPKRMKGCHHASNTFQKFDVDCNYGSLSIKVLIIQMGFSGLQFQVKIFCELATAA